MVCWIGVIVIPAVFPGKDIKNKKQKSFDLIRFASRRVCFVLCCSVDTEQHHFVVCVYLVRSSYLSSPPSLFLFLDFSTLKKTKNQELSKDIPNSIPSNEKGQLGSTERITIALSKTITDTSNKKDTYTIIAEPF